jgi:hypothetical protein
VQKAKNASISLKKGEQTRRFQRFITEGFGKLEEREGEQAKLLESFQRAQGKRVK